MRFNSGGSGKPSRLSSYSTSTASAGTKMGCENVFISVNFVFSRRRIAAMMRSSISMLHPCCRARLSEDHNSAGYLQDAFRSRRTQSAYLKLRPHLPEFRKQFHLEHPAQIGYARGAAG